MTPQERENCLNSHTSWRKELLFGPTIKFSGWGPDSIDFSRIKFEITPFDCKIIIIIVLTQCTIVFILIGIYDELSFSEI